MFNILIRIFFTKWIKPGWLTFFGDGSWRNCWNQWFWRAIPSFLSMLCFYLQWSKSMSIFKRKICGIISSFFNWCSNDIVKCFDCCCFFWEFKNRTFNKWKACFITFWKTNNCDIVGSRVHTVNIPVFKEKALDWFKQISGLCRQTYSP